MPVVDSAADLTVNLYPPLPALSRLYWDIVRSYNWKSFTILYQDEEGLIRLQDLLSVSTDQMHRVLGPSLRRYRPQSNEDLPCWS